MRIKNGKSVKIISFAKKEEQPIQFVDVQVGQVRQDRQQIQFVDVQDRQLENRQMGQKEESQPKVIHLEKGQSDIGHLKYGQSSTNGHLEVIRPKLFAKTKTVLNKNETERQVVERWTDLDNEQTDKGQQKPVGQKKQQNDERHSEERHFEERQEEFENGQKDKGQQKLVGQKTKQSEDRHSNIYHSEERQLENGQFEEGQHDVGHLGKGQPEVKVVLKRLRFLHCSGKTY